MGIKITLIFILLSSSLAVHARQVEHVEVIESGHYDGLAEDKDGYAKWCKLFNPTKEQLINYFAKAEEADYIGEWLHEHYSPCVASGTVTFKDGSYGTWGLHSSGLGGVTFQDKNNFGKRKSFLYLDNAWEDE
ncbi:MULTISPECIES: hypothetical protein [Erwinia]|uniref:hypothetical protein n=1 Tax=Erwinia TaxID=551 RepID=UPI00105C44E1|nr:MULTISPECIES: hypothetical protein [Erwinia]MBP2155870.1 hypothetical protein [Erwinia rhapontici]MCS3606147.1 hypothetical protein [Erwinia rhapontici]NKG30511.1 hypothetical protein [Erwinia rhapontici]NNS05723.1 hypothetical protein [Erwinia sp. JH02]TDS92920.1 hypothetical protein EDF84_11292 [Erwinia rhapontici]